MTPIPAAPTFNHESPVLPGDVPAAARLSPPGGVAAGSAFQSSDGGTGVQPFVPAEAVGKIPAPRNISGKQEGRTGIEVGTSQTPGSPMLSARTLPTPAEQAPGPSEAKSSLTERRPTEAPAREPNPSAGALVPPGYRLVKVETLEMLQREFQRLKREKLERERSLPAFLRAPRPEFLAAIQRGNA